MKLQENDNEDNFNYSFHILTSLLLLKRSQVSLCPKQQFSFGGLLCHLVKLYQFFNCLPLANTRHQTETETSVLSVINFLWPKLPALSLAAQIDNLGKVLTQLQPQLRWLIRHFSTIVSVEWINSARELKGQLVGSHRKFNFFYYHHQPTLSLEFSDGGEVNYFNMIML